MSAYVAEWDQVLRGLVFEAWAAKETDDFDAAVHRIIDAHAVWPLAEAEWYLDRAAELIAEGEQEDLEWYEAVFASFDRKRERVAA